jgi:hypothetical protein
MNAAATRFANNRHGGAIDHTVLRLRRISGLAQKPHYLQGFDDRRTLSSYRRCEHEAMG